MKKLVPEYEFSAEESREVKRLARALDLTETTASILFARGLKEEDEMRAFLHPSSENFLSPFLMRGMREAKEMLERAREEEWRVAVFGDYDADGIGACAILWRALKRFGIEPYLYVPERADGYGVSVSAVDKIFDEFLPDLVVTVDCGISNRKEVEYIKEQGAYVIVTDHHELPDELPDCIVVNPKLDDDYPYDNLCGAGVAFKLACALIGEEAYDLLDFCALSTVADSVPLLGENRDIVAEGLKRIAKRPRPAFSALLGKSSEVTAQTLAFTLAPRVNAAGRMGDADCALRLFTSEDEEEIALLAEKLNLYNIERQKCCDELYAQAVSLLAREGAFGNVVMLAGEDWNAGFAGIVAARIAEEYGRPTLLFVRRGDMLKGSARSVERVNIFEALKACSAYIEEFGGHAQAAGVNVKAENFSALKEALNRYIGERYTREDFEPRIPVCGEGPLADRRLAHELNALEPFGMGNRRPLFTCTARRLDAALLKPLSPHVSIAGEGMDFMYFGGADELKLLRSGLKKTLVFEYNLSVFRGREYLKGFVRDVVYGGAEGAETEAFENAVLSLRSPTVRAERSDTASLDAFIASRRAECAYGLCAVYTERGTPARFPSVAGLAADVFRPASSSENTLLYAPDAGCDLSAFREIIYLDEPCAVGVAAGNARVLVNGEIAGDVRLRRLDIARETLLSVFVALRAAEGRQLGTSYAEAARAWGTSEFSEELVVFALAVFEELGLISLADGRLSVFRGKRTDLMNSALYRAALACKEN